MAKMRCIECRGTGYAEPAAGFTFGNNCPVCKGEGWLTNEWTALTRLAQEEGYDVTHTP
jgi:DnaJ-class molecular chaperone